MNPMREQLRLLQTNRDVAAYPDGLLSLVKIGLEYFVVWRRAFTECKMFVLDTCLEPTDDGKGMRLTLLGQLFAEWHFVEHYVPNTAEWAEYVRYMFALYIEQVERIDLSYAIFSTYSHRLTNIAIARTALRKYVQTLNMILDAKGKNHDRT